MFENIGKKIKSLANVVCWVGIVAYIIVAIVLFAMRLAAVGIILLVVGSLLSWVGSFFMYGFGELVDKVCDIERKLRNCEKSSDPKSDRIENLKRLLAQGLITEEEYRQSVSKIN